MNGTREPLLSEISQSDKYHMISFICGINEQTGLTRKMGTDSQMKGRMTAIRGVGVSSLGNEETEQKEKRTHGHGQQCGECWGDGSIKRTKWQ